MKGLPSKHLEEELNLVLFGTAEEASEDLRELLLDAITTQMSPGVRYCSVQWATKLFPFPEPSARYICILAAGDKKTEVSEAGQNGLKPNNPTGEYIQQ